MDNLFTWIILIGVVVSVFSKAANKSGQKTQGSIFDLATKNQTMDQLLKSRTISEAQNIAVGKLSEQLTKRSQAVNIPMEPRVVTARPVASVKTETTITQKDESFGEGFTDAEGSWFGDGNSSVEGECVEDHDHDGQEALATFDKETAQAFDKEIEVERKWSLDIDNLQSAFIFSEVLGQPKSRRGQSR